ncbi:diguanylate cyclase [Pararhizobium sp.]|uniref:GGDEF domain-containing protein n=1 Tax=Pararhizobium sp. TaxID=1977563 RepID=UPI003BAB47F5
MPLKFHSYSDSGRLGGLRGRLWFMAVLAIICTLLLATSTISASVDAFRNAQAGAENMRQFTAIFDAANLISAERGPANTLMTAGDADRTDALSKWKQTVENTNAALDELKQRDMPDVMIDGVRARLTSARGLIDAILRQPRQGRRYEEIHAAIGAMFAARDSYRRIIEWQSGQILMRDPDLAAIVVQGIALSDLREYAGRLGSYVIAPMAAGTALTPQDIAASNAARGRLLEAWDLVGPRSASPVSDLIRLKRQEVEEIFMRLGMALIDEQMALGSRSGRFSTDGAAFTQRYVMLMQPLEELRKFYLAEIVAEFEAGERQALLALYRSGLATAVLLLLVLGLVAAVQIYILRPLLKGAQAVIALAEERPAELAAATGEVPEIMRLYSAIGILGQRLGERAVLTRKLEILAATDGLTGLLNRRALENHAAKMETGRARYLILLDIDHFKSINDRHGHPFGDLVLRAIADLMRQSTQSSGYAARFGGEEFAILLAAGSLAEAAWDARKLRMALEKSPLKAPDGTMLIVTASFGVADGTGRTWSDILVQADAALYRAKDAGRNRVRIFRTPD